MEKPARESSIDIRQVTKRFGEFVAVDDVSLTIQRGEFFSLLGPSGCGKTTLLRMIAGFESPTSGGIFLENREITPLPPYQRPVNLVFQHYALFPHLSAGKNVAFGLRYKNLDRGTTAERVERALDLVRLGGLANRKPHEMSGGQRQRVALARALVLEPQVLLLDEPLGALDQKLRKEMQVELKTLQKRLGITFVFVTHDHEEAITMSDRIAVMNGGRVEQLGACAEVFEKPRTEFVARFMGATNVLSADEHDADSRPLGEIAGMSGGREVSHVIRPEKLRLRRERAPRGGEWLSIPVTIEQRIYQGLTTIWLVRTASGTELTVCEQNHQPIDETATNEELGQAFVWLDGGHIVTVAAENSAAAFGASLARGSKAKSPEVLGAR